MKKSTCFLPLALILMNLVKRNNASEYPSVIQLMYVQNSVINEPCCTDRVSLGHIFYYSVNFGFKSKIRNLN